MTTIYTIPRDSTGQSPKPEIDTSVTVTSGDAAFFCSSSGELVYLGKTHRASSPYNTPQATFDDDGTDLPYLDLETDYSDTFLFNYWIVTAVGGTSVIAQDAASIKQYDIRSKSIDNLPIDATAPPNTSATDMANSNLAKYKDPMVRVTKIEPDTSNLEALRVCLGLDLMQAIRVFRTPPGGGARFDQTVWIQSIKRSGVPGQLPKIEFGVSPR